MRNAQSISGARQTATKAANEKTAQAIRLSVRKKILFASFTIVFLFGAVEISLRCLAYQHDSAIESMAFTFPLDDYNKAAPTPYLERDSRLFWKPKPNVLGHNSMGVFGAEFSREKPPGVFRIVCLGDSCTHFGPRPYPQRLQEMLAARKPDALEVINAGVIGYTSYQGLVRMRSEVSDWSPDLVTVYFGWNDHWLARALRDSQQQDKLTLAGRLHNALNHSRVFQALMHAESAFVAKKRLECRVEIGEYADNLREIKRVGDRLGADVWFLTAPHALDLGLPVYLLSSGEVGDPHRVIDLHRSYNEVVRLVAREVGAPLIDLERQFDSLPKAPLFMPDHIHLSDAGRTLVAETLLKRLEAKL